VPYIACCSGEINVYLKAGVVKVINYSENNETEQL